MSEHIHKSHNVSLLLYHVVCPTKYRRAVIDPEVDVVLKSVCFDISNRYEISFVEIGADRDHVHFLVQSVPTMSPYSLVQRIKSITVKKYFAAPHKYVSNSGAALSGLAATTSTRLASTATKRRSRIILPTKVGCPNTNQFTVGRSILNRFV